jgi:hypothetical protein
VREMRLASTWSYKAEDFVGRPLSYSVSGGYPILYTPTGKKCLL